MLIPSSMKKLLFLLLLPLMGLTAMADPNVLLEGAVGKYKIEMALHLSFQDDSGLAGWYRYAGKTASLDLKGDLMGGNVLFLVESFGGKETGQFYMDTANQEEWTGTWIGNGKSLPCTLNVRNGEMKQLMPYDLEAVNAEVEEGITGSYVDETYFINDMWFSDENPQLELGFNGGVVTVREIDDFSISVYFNLVCGPTYHLAYFSGEASKTGPNTYEFFASVEGEDKCHLIFKFQHKGLVIEQQSASFACGFGARAYADGSFMKVNNETLEGEDLGIRDVIR